MPDHPVPVKNTRRVLIVSDEHRGAEISNFWAYQRAIIAKMSEYDDVVLLGDNAELFYLQDPEDHCANYASLLDVVAGGGQEKWKQHLSRHKAQDPYYKVRNAVEAESAFYRQFLEHFPKVRLHKVAGNHENAWLYRHAMEDILSEQRRKGLDNFEWSPEAIRLGDALFTHGHLQMSGKTDEKFRIKGLKWATEHHKWTALYSFFDTFGFHVAKRMRRPDKSARFLHRQHEEWAGATHRDDKPPAFCMAHDGDDSIGLSFISDTAGTYKFHYVENGVRRDWLREDMEKIKHVFFGHTHVKFHEPSEEEGTKIDGVSYYNTGAVVKATSGTPDGLGILEAELNADGSLSNIRPVTGIDPNRYSVRVNSR